MPPLAQSANAEAIAGESSAVPLEDEYLEGIVQVLPTVEFCARTAEAPKPTERSKESILRVAQKIGVYETISTRNTVCPYTTPLNCHISIESLWSRGVVLPPHDGDTANNLCGWKQFVRRRSRLQPKHLK